MTQTKFSTIPKENWDSETDIESKNISPAEDWNQITSEVIDVIEKSGEEADTSLQIAQAIMKNALCADFFTDTSTVANTIVLTDNGTFAKPVEYTDGMKVSFLANYSNTGSATINVNGLGVKNIYLDANSTPLAGTEIKEKEIVNLRYNSILDGFIIVLGGGGGGSSRNIGEIVQSTIPLTDAGLHLLDGSLILAGGSYNAFYLYMKNLYDGGLYNDIFETEVNWQASVSTYGVCGKYVFEDGVSVRIPKMEGFTEGTINPTDLGDLTEAGLPNITGQVSGISESFGTHGTASGCHTAIKDVVTGVTPVTVDNGQVGRFTTDASLSNPIYGNSTTVQPQSIKVLYYVCVATAVKTDIVVDIDNIMTDLNGKADVDGNNATFTNLSDPARKVVSNNAMPSSSYVDLSLGVSGTVYTAPENGYVSFCSYATAPGGVVALITNGDGIRTTVTAGSGGNPSLRCFLPIAKGKQFRADYVLIDNLQPGFEFRFYYNNGDI